MDMQHIDSELLKHPIILDPLKPLWDSFREAPVVPVTKEDLYQLRKLQGQSYNTMLWRPDGNVRINLSQISAEFSIARTYFPGMQEFMFI